MDDGSTTAALHIVVSQSGLRKVIAEDRLRSLPLAHVLFIIRTRAYYKNVVDQIDRMRCDLHEVMKRDSKNGMSGTFWVRRHFSELYPWVYMLRKNRWRNDSRYNLEMRCVDQWRENVVLMTLNYSDYTRKHLASGGRNGTPHDSTFWSLRAPPSSPLDRSDPS